MVSPSSPPALFLSPTGVRRYTGNKLSLTSSSLSSPRKGSFHPPRDGLNRRGISKIVSTCIRKSFSRTQPSMQRLIHPLLNRQSVSFLPRLLLPSAPAAPLLSHPALSLTHEPTLPPTLSLSLSLSRFEQPLHAVPTFAQPIYIYI